MVVSPFSNSIEGALYGAIGALLKLGCEAVVASRRKDSKPIRASFWATISAIWLITGTYVATGSLAASLIASSMPMDHLPVVFRPVWAALGYFLYIEEMLIAFRNWSPLKAVKRVAAEILKSHGCDADFGEMNARAEENRAPQIILNATVSESCVFNGEWVSADRGSRLSLNVEKSALTITEHHANKDVTLSRSVVLRKGPCGHFFAERKTDNDILKFLGVENAKVRKGILASDPPSSSIELWLDNGKLKGIWLRILARKSPGKDTQHVLYKAERDVEFIAVQRP